MLVLLLAGSHLEQVLSLRNEEVKQGRYERSLFAPLLPLWVGWVFRDERASKDGTLATLLCCSHALCGSGIPWHAVSRNGER